MALPFFNTALKVAKGPDQLLSIDLGGRMTKAVRLQRKGNGFILSGFTLVDAPVYEKTLSVEMLSEHLKTVWQAFEPKGKQVSIAVGVNDSIVRTAEMPAMPVDDMRQILKINAKTYLQQELPDYVFDCAMVATKKPAAPAEKKAPGAKAKVLVAGAKRRYVDDVQMAVRNATLVADHIIPSLVGPPNAFEVAMPELFNQEVVALVDVGFKNSSICILQQGELILSRVVNIGGDRLTSGLAEALSITYAEAEGIKIGMPHEVQPQLENLISPLGRELRASVDFFEHQQDRTVGHIFISGGSARSEFIVQSLRTELGVECKTWNPAATLQLALPPQQAAEMEHIAPQLTVAIGAALAAF
jgi:type IV pilus assembly protein PilM